MPVIRGKNVRTGALLRLQSRKHGFPGNLWCRYADALVLPELAAKYHQHQRIFKAAKNATLVYRSPAIFSLAVKRNLTYGIN